MDGNIPFDAESQYFNVVKPETIHKTLHKYSQPAYI